MDAATTMNPQGSYFYYVPEQQQTPEARHQAFVHQQMLQHQQQATAAFYYAALPHTPVYSRPSSSSSQHQPILLSQKPYHGQAVHYMPPHTPSAVPRSVAMPGKPAMMLETSFVSDVEPATPTLSASNSTASSTMSSPGPADVLSSNANPMLSFDGFKDVSNEAMLEHYNAALSCRSPPYTPVFVQAPAGASQPLAHSQASTVSGSDLLTVSACPSLSSSPAPFPEQDHDFCDPRNLTVCTGSEGSVSPTLSTVQVASPSPVEIKEEFAPALEMEAIGPASTINDFIAHLPSLEEFPGLEGDDEFGNLVNLGLDYSSHSSIAATPEMSLRSRASSSVTTHSEPVEFFESFESATFESTASEQPSKRQRTSSVTFAVPAAPTETGDASASAAGSPEQASESQTTTDNAANAAPAAETSSETEKSGKRSGSAPVINRRGRKQSLTEDPSKIFACDLCNRRFRRQEHLKRHYRSLHTQDKPFNCHECGKKFSRSDNLAQHARTHGSGSMVMNVFEDAEMVAAANGGYMPSHMMYAGQGVPMNSDNFSAMGRALLQFGADAPSTVTGEHADGDAQGKKKRKRSD